MLPKVVLQWSNLKQDFGILMELGNLSQILMSDTADDAEDEDSVPYEDLRPTYTHEALAKLMHMGLLKYIISQNADGLHLLSGQPALTL